MKEARYCTVPECGGRFYGRGYCNKHYQRVRKSGDPTQVKFLRGSSIEESFALHTTRDGDCILWTAGRDRSSQYGQVRYKGRLHRAHRVAWEMANGPIPDGLVIDHICHVFLCVNPQHLRLATRKQNRENLEGASKNSATGIRGAYWSKKDRRFLAQVKHNGKTIHLGSFHTVEEAGEAARAKRIELFTHNDADRKTA